MNTEDMANALSLLGWMVCDKTPRSPYGTFVRCGDICLLVDGNEIHTYVTSYGKDDIECNVSTMPKTRIRTLYRWVTR